MTHRFILIYRPQTTKENSSEWMFSFELHRKILQKKKHIFTGGDKTVSRVTTLTVSNNNKRKGVTAANIPSLVLTR